MREWGGWGFPSESSGGRWGKGVKSARELLCRAGIQKEREEVRESGEPG